MALTASPAHTATAETDPATLIHEWNKVRPGVYEGRDGWQIRKIRSTTSFCWVTYRPDGSEVRARHGGGWGHRSALSAQLEAAYLIVADAKTR